MSWLKKNKINEDDDISLNNLLYNENASSEDIKTFGSVRRIVNKAVTLKKFKRMP